MRGPGTMLPRDPFPDGEPDPTLGAVLAGGRHAGVQHAPDVSHRVEQQDVVLRGRHALAGRAVARGNHVGVRIDVARQERPALVARLLDRRSFWRPNLRGGPDPHDPAGLDQDRAAVDGRTAGAVDDAVRGQQAEVGRVGLGHRAPFVDGWAEFRRSDGCGGSVASPCDRAAMSVGAGSTRQVVGISIGTGAVRSGATVCSRSSRNATRSRGPGHATGRSLGRRGALRRPWPGSARRSTGDRRAAPAARARRADSHRRSIGRSRSRSWRT